LAYAVDRSKHRFSIGMSGRTVLCRDEHRSRGTQQRAEARRHMDSDQTTNILVPFHTWGPKGRMILRRFDHLRGNDVGYVVVREDDLIERLQRVLFMARRAVLDLIRGL
jgi:hypothetical protein